MHERVSEMPDVPRLHLISARRHCPLDQFPVIAGAASRGGVDAVHVRERDVPAGQQLELVRSVQRACAGLTTRVLVNDRVDIALLTDADGVHLPENGLPVAGVRRIFSDSALIGVSVHSVERACSAVEAGADYIMAGHIFDTDSKRGTPGRGIAFLQSICESVSVPVIAIGGITPDRVAEVLRCGAWGVAVLSGILRAREPEGAAREYRIALNSAKEASQ